MSIRRPAIAAIVAIVMSLLGACSGGDGNDAAKRANGSAESEATNSDTGGGGDCSLVDAGTVGDLFAIEVTSVDAPLKGRCDFLPDPDPETPDVHVTVLRNELGQVLWDEFSDEVKDVGEGGGGSGLVNVDLGDEGVAAPGPNAVDLVARRGDVNVRITATVPSATRLSQDELLAAATELAKRLL